MQPIQPLVSVITVNYNQIEATCALLDSLRAQNWKHYEVWVVDNGSLVNPETHLNVHYPEARVIRSEVNLGFAGGNNLALKQAQGDYLFLLNNDTEVTPESIGQLVRFLQQHPRCGAVSPLLCYYPSAADLRYDIIQYAGMTPVSSVTARNSTIGAGEEDRGQYSAPAPTAYTHGAAMLLPAAVMEQAGLMPEEYFLYYEELDWCEQIKAAGYDLWVAPTAKIYHKESLSTGASGALKTYFLCRNRLLFVQRNKRWKSVFYTYFLLVALPKAVLSAFLKGEKEQLKAIVQAARFFFFGKQNSFEQFARTTSRAQPEALAIE